MFWWRRFSCLKFCFLFECVFVVLYIKHQQQLVVAFGCVLIILKEKNLQLHSSLSSELLGSSTTAPTTKQTSWHLYGVCAIDVEQQQFCCLAWYNKACIACYRVVVVACCSRVSELEPISLPSLAFFVMDMEGTFPLSCCNIIGCCK